MIRKKKRTLILLVVSLIFSSCKESTKPETVTFSGSVTLGNESDYSPIGAGGVKVS